MVRVGALSSFSCERSRQPQESDERLGILARSDRLIEPVQRPWNDLDPLVLVGLCVGCVGEVGRRVQPYALVREPGAGVERGDLLPALSLLADFLGQLALGGVDRLLALDV